MRALSASTTPLANTQECMRALGVPSVPQSQQRAAVRDYDSDWATSEAAHPEATSTTGTSPENAQAIADNGELFGTAGRYGVEPAVRAYRGPSRRV